MARGRTPKKTAYEAIACLGRLSEVFQRRRQQLAADVGLTELEWRVLEEISSVDFMPSLFARRRETTAAGVSRVLRHLLDKKLVATSIDASDGRQRKYALTKRGQRLLERITELREEAVQNVWLELERDDLEAFVAIGSRLAERLEAYAGPRDQEG